MMYNIYMPRKTESERYWEKVDKRSDTECWDWTSKTTQKGYGRFYIKDDTTTNGLRGIGAHRYTYIINYGDIPDGLVVNHKCFNRRCQNPKHLNLMTAVENSKRENRNPITHCKNGHKFTKNNTRFHTVTGGRICKVCANAYSRAYLPGYRKARKGVV